MTALVESAALAGAAEYLMYPGAVDSALAEARRHDHRSFIWSVQHRARAAEPAQAKIDACLAGARACEKTLPLVGALGQATARPVFSDGRVQLGDQPRYKTRHPEVVLGLWDLLHPAHPMLSEMTSGKQLETADPAAVYRFFDGILREDKVAARAAELEAAIATVNGRRRAGKRARDS